MVVLAPKAAPAGAGAPRCVGPYAQLVADLDELVGRVRVGVSADERGGEVGAAAVVAAAVRVEAAQGEVLLDPGRVGEGVGLEEGHHVVLDGHILAAAHAEVLQRVDLRRQHAADERDARDGRVAQVQARQAGAVGGDNLLQQRVERVGLARALAAVGRLVARRAHSDGGLRQAEAQRLPSQRVRAQEGAQVAARVVQVEQRARRDLGEQRLQHGRVRRDDGLEQAERRIVGVDRRLLAPPREGARRARSRGRSRRCGVGRRAPEEVRLGLLLRAHAARRRVRQHVEVEALGQRWPYEAVLSDEAARKHAKESDMQEGSRGVCSAGEVGGAVQAGSESDRVCMYGDRSWKWMHGREWSRRAHLSHRSAASRPPCLTAAAYRDSTSPTAILPAVQHPLGADSG
jgi:hypothetical protein